MPLWRMYDYRCETCSYEEERLVDPDKKDDQLCGECLLLTTRLDCAPKIRQVTGPQSVTVSRGKPDEPPPGALVTRRKDW